METRVDWLTMSNSDSKEPYAWLLTVAQKDCGGFAKIPTRQHPADYVLANDRYSLIFAIPLSKKQYLVAQKWYEGNNGITDAGPRLRQMNDALAEIERLRAEVAMLKDAAEKLYDIAASGAEPIKRRRMLDQMAMESFAEHG